MSTPKPRTVVICSTCRSADVTHDANAAWSPALQAYELAGVMDAAYCNRCGGECSTIEVPLEDRLAWLKEKIDRDDDESTAVEQRLPEWVREELDAEFAELQAVRESPLKELYANLQELEAMKACLVLVADKLEDWGTDIQQDITAEEDELERWRTEHGHYTTACRLIGITPETFPEEMTDGA